MKPLLLGSIVLLFAAAVLAAQRSGQREAASTKLPTELSNIRFNSGQSVVPYFEGWIRNTDGTFDLVFGYFNRNWQQELAIAVGPDNDAELGGQPTYFLPRRQRFIYRVRVPKDFGKKELVWTLTANGRTEKAYGTLLPQQEITDRVVMTNGGFDPGLNDPNKPPSVTIGPVESPVADRPVALLAFVSDDGLPKPRAAAARRPASSPFGGQVNSSTGSEAPAGLTLTWMQYGGPAKVVFEPGGPIPVANGQAVISAKFPQPGTYELVALANDRAMTTRVAVKITVR
jgi:hypothetical protein